MTRWLIFIKIPQIRKIKITFKYTQIYIFIFKFILQNTKSTSEFFNTAFQFLILPEFRKVPEPKYIHFIKYTHKTFFMIKKYKFENQFIHDYYKYLIDNKIHLDIITNNRMFFVKPNKYCYKNDIKMTVFH